MIGRAVSSQAAIALRGVLLGCVARHLRSRRSGEAEIVPVASSWRTAAGIVGRRPKWFFSLKGGCEFRVPSGPVTLAAKRFILVPRGMQHIERPIPSAGNYRSVLVIAGNGELRMLEVRKVAGTVGAIAILRQRYSQTDRLERRSDAVIEVQGQTSRWARLFQAALALLANMLETAAAQRVCL